MAEITRVPAFVRLLDGLVSASEMNLKGEKAEVLRRGMIEINAIEPIVQVVRDSGAPERNVLETYLRDELDRHVKEAVDKEFEGYRVWLLSSGLVLVVAFLDSFLDEVVRTVLEADPKRLLSAAQDRQVDLKEVLASPSREALIASEIDRVARRVAFMNLKDRLAFIEKRLGLPIAQILEWDDFTDEAKALLGSWDLDRFVEVHDWRHEVAHQGSTASLTSIDELSTVAEVFARFVMAVAMHARRIFDIPFDWEEQWARWTAQMGSVRADAGPIA